MSKLKSKKYLIITICIIVISIVYFCAQKAIDNYLFDSNSDIYTEDNSEEGPGDEKNEVKDSSSELSSDEELNLVMEETEAGQKEDIKSGVNTAKENKIYVYITGEVNNPGVVILNEGSRIVDAINAAGGTTIEANVSKVNLVYILTDGMKVNIPSNNDLKDDSSFEYITTNSGDGEITSSGTKSSSVNSSEGRF